MLSRFQLGATTFSVAALLLAASPAHAASWTSLGYGGTTKADIYVPDKALSPRPILFSIHYCSGQASNARSWFQSYADQHGFIIITPNAGGNCFDAQAKRMGQVADFAAMSAWTVTNKDGDAKRVFASGLSSGACMTQAVVAAYPDVFAAGSSLAGVPAGAWTASNNDYGWTTSGTTGEQAWGDKVRQADPGWTGQWGRMQIWHGEADTTLTYGQTWTQECQQWANVHGFTVAEGMMASIKPAGATSTWQRASYIRNNIELVETNHAAGITHDLGAQGLWQDAVRFFELDKSQADTTYGKDNGTAGTGGMGSGGMPAGGSAGTGPASGGMPSSGGMPGAAGMGMPAGGSPATGGTGMTTGGAPATGGTGAGTGGASTTGGTGMTGAGTGGTGMPAAGTTGVGGAGPATGGTGMGTGGAGGTAGSVMGTGGTAPAAGGTGNVMGGSGTTGSGAVGGTSPTEPPPDEAGCGCRVGSSQGTETSALAALGLGVLGLALRRRRSAAKH